MGMNTQLGGHASETGGIAGDVTTDVYLAYSVGIAVTPQDTRKNRAAGSSIIS
jgi:hypothetical protein